MGCKKGDQWMGDCNTCTCRRDGVKLSIQICTRKNCAQERETKEGLTANKEKWQSKFGGGNGANGGGDKTYEEVVGDDSNQKNEDARKEYQLSKGRKDKKGSRGR